MGHSRLGVNTINNNNVCALLYNSLYSRFLIKHHYRSMDKLQYWYYQCQPVYPVQSAQDVFNGLTRTIHTQQSVLVTGISKNLMLHDGDRHHWLTVSNLTRNCIRLCYIACSCIALMFELKWLVCDRQRVHAYSKFCRRACINENLDDCGI